MKTPPTAEGECIGDVTLDRWVLNLSVKLMVNEADWRSQQRYLVMLTFNDGFGGVVGFTGTQADLVVGFVADGIDEDVLTDLNRQRQECWFD